MNPRPNNLIHRIGEDMLPMPVEKFFSTTPAPDDKWRAGELPPTDQSYLNSPEVQRARATLHQQAATTAADMLRKGRPNRKTRRGDRRAGK